MSTSMTLLELRTAVRQRSDMQNQSGIYDNAFIKDDELTSYINQSYFELYDLLVTAYGEDYYVASPYFINTDGSSLFYDLPADFYKLLGVDVQIANSANQAWFTLKTFTFGERNKYAVPNTQLYFGLANLRYRIHGDKIWLNPLAQANQTLRLFYVPRMTTLVDDTDEVQGVSGWTEYIIIDAAIKCLQKEESSTTVLQTQKKDMLKRIEGVANNRDAGMAVCVSDIRSINSYSPYTNDGGWY